MKKAYLFKIKDGTKDAWESWCKEISTTLINEATTTLHEEKVEHELSLGLTLSDQGYCIGYMDGDCLPANMDREINKRHKEMKETCLERIGEVSILYDIKAFG